MSEPWVVIPTYNESNNAPRLVAELFALNIPRLHVLIVDDNSPDGTGQAVRKLQPTYPHLYLLTRPNKSGLGRAYIHGFCLALERGASTVVQMDADFSHDPKDVPRLLGALSEADVVIGSRYIGGISVVNWPLFRLLLSTAANQYARLVTGLPYQDVTGGFRAWTSFALQQLDLTSIKADGYGFQIVTAFRAAKKKLRIKEIPIIFTERRAGDSKMNRAIMWEAFWLVLKLRLFG
ncbi:MAG: polyprenol monophosphomannose synthase [Candidatus Andersenbacteria bacterium]|nr:polyprenol monophosphomannose synthase [Candidatus Andersenbacteria bacterium]